MPSQFVVRFLYSFFLIFGLGMSASTIADDAADVDALLERTKQYLNTEPEKSVLSLAHLQTLKSTFTKKQEDQYYFYSVFSLGLRGKNEDRVKLILSVIDKVTDPVMQIKFLYQLSVGYTNLGEYEKALVAINRSMVLLPQVAELGPKITTLQSAITLLNSLHAYDDAMIYADRMVELGLEGQSNLIAKCYGMANKIEIDFLRNKNMPSEALLSKTMQVCDESNLKIISLILKTLAQIDILNSEHSNRDVIDSISLLRKFSKSNQTSEYVTQLEEAIARSYLQKKDFLQAEQYGLRAYQRATAENAVQLMEKTSETMAKIKRAQGKLTTAQEYYDINLGLKEKMLDQQLLKSMAYQRVKFDTQDKANQLALAEQKNKNLIFEKILQQGENKILLLSIALSLIILTIVGAWLIRALRQKNLFRTSSQIDHLTQVSNRAHFMACATQAFKNSERRVTLVLVDMDLFKNINDTFGHAAGDWVLKTVCAAIKTQLRQADMFGRLGGEEFAICLPDLTPEAALALAERCRAAVAAIDTYPSGFSFEITASFGVATRDNGKLSTFEETLAAADKALYISKNEGRDRVSVYQ